MSMIHIILIPILILLNIMTPVQLGVAPATVVYDKCAQMYSDNFVRNLKEQ
jgi:hypothetical protein